MTNRLLPFLALVAAVGIFFAYVNPLWHGAIKDAKAAIAQDNQALDAADAYVTRENELAAQVNAIDPAALARLSTYLPDSVDNVGLILDLNSLAESTGVVLSSVDVAGSGQASTGQAATTGTSAATTGTDAAAGGSPVGTIDLTLSAKGTYDALLAFLNGVEYSERLLDVTDLAVTGSNSGVYDYRMTIRLYWLR